MSLNKNGIIIKKLACDMNFSFKGLGQQMGMVLRRLQTFFAGMWNKSVNNT